MQRPALGLADSCCRRRVSHTPSHQLREPAEEVSASSELSRHAEELDDAMEESLLAPCQTAGAALRDFIRGSNAGNESWRTRRAVCKGQMVRLYSSASLNVVDAYEADNNILKNTL